MSLGYGPPPPILNTHPHRISIPLYKTNFISESDYVAWRKEEIDYIRQSGVEWYDPAETFCVIYYFDFANESDATYFKLKFL